METLENLRSSILRSLNESFKDAASNLRDEFAFHDSRIREIEHKANLAHEERLDALAKVETLEHELSAIRSQRAASELQGDRSRASSMDSTVATRGLLYKQYNPEHILRCSEDSENGHFPPEDNFVVAKYKAMFNDVTMLADAYEQLMMEVDRQKNKLRQWQRNTERDEFKITLDNGHIVTFKQVQEHSTGSNGKGKIQPQIPRSDTGYMQTRGMEIETPGTTQDCTPEYGLPGVSQMTVGKRTVHNDPPAPYFGQSDPPSTQSDSPSEFEAKGQNNALVTQAGRRTTSSDAIHPSLAFHGNTANGQSEPPAVKSEPLSPSPLQDAPLHSDLNSSGTQDLDEPVNKVGTLEKESANTIRLPQAVQRGHRHPTVLQPVDINGNAQASNVSDHRNGTKKRKAQVIPSGTGDGDENQINIRSKTTANRRAPDSARKRSTVHPEPKQKRLETLLEEPSRRKQPLLPMKSPTSVGYPRRNQSGRVRKGQSAQVNTNTSPNRMPSEKGGPAAPRSNVHNPQRNLQPRPDSELTLADFKVNAANNQGVDYLFQSVVRKRDERMCLAGCTSEHCCGPVFRALARTLSCSEDEAHQIMEEYLGEEKHLLDDLNDTDRERIFIEARTRSLANRYGRHKANQQRPASPPGFWRTEMPTTQELQRDHEEADRRERQKIEERRREALRPNGLWKFSNL